MSCWPVPSVLPLLSRIKRHSLSRLTSLLGLSGLIGLSGCGVAIDDLTDPVINRQAGNQYQLSVRVEPANGAVSVINVNAVTSQGTIALAPTGNHRWAGTIQLPACANGFDLRYEATWQQGLAGNIHAEPFAGATQKWLTGVPGAACGGGTGRRFVVDSNVDLPDLVPGDGRCLAFGGVCTLRAAVMEANALRGQDRIELASTTYGLNRAGEDDNAANGDLDITDEVAIVGTGATQITGAGHGDRIFDIRPGASTPVRVELRNLTISNGAATDGAGVRNHGILQMIGVTLRDNVAVTAGGGLFNEGGTVILRDVDVRNNRAGTYLASSGGGLFSRGDSADVEIRASSVIGNHSMKQHGGGVSIEAGHFYARDSTFADNRSAVHGGAFYILPNARVDLRQVTITGNVADADDSGAGNGGGINHPVGSGWVRVANSIIAQNRAVQGPDCNGHLDSSGFNLLGTDASCAGPAPPWDLVGSGFNVLDPKLAVLGPGGRFRRPELGSPVIDAARLTAPNDADFPACTHVDQAGNARPRGPYVNGRQRCDIGAIER